MRRKRIEIHQNMFLLLFFIILNVAVNSVMLLTLNIVEWLFILWNYLLVSKQSTIYKYLFHQFNFNTEKKKQSQGTICFMQVSTHTQRRKK
jgi:hypothetical protein